MRVLKHKHTMLYKRYLDYIPRQISSRGRDSTGSKVAQLQNWTRRIFGKRLSVSPPGRKAPEDYQEKDLPV